MTKLLEKAFIETQRLPKKEQDVMAEWILSELDDEKVWDSQFSTSPNLLEKLALEALSESANGRTKPLTPDLL